MQKIDTVEFEKRLEVLCLKGGGLGLPGKDRDQHILFKSMVLLLDAQRSYSEKEINAAMKQWLVKIGRAIDIDHVTLRRYLVDEEYLLRDSAGSVYRVNDKHGTDRFEPGIDAILPGTVIEDALERREQRRLRYVRRMGKMS